MKKNLLFACVLLLTGPAIFAQYPDNFNYVSYVTDVRDQLVQKPCYVHATIAGIETMYNMYYGANINIDLSERALFSCSRTSPTRYLESLGPVIEYVRQNGAILEDCKEYPGPLVPCEANGNLWNTIFDTNFDCDQNQKDCGFRFKIDALGISINHTDPNTVKKNLLSYGPIIFSNGNHAMLLIGWEGTNWIVKDSYPCDASIALRIPFNGPSREAVIFSEAFVIKGITKEKFDTTTNIWSVETAPPIQYINLNLGFLKIAMKSVPKPLCFNRGIVYELIGLDNLIDTEVTWSYAASNTYSNNISLTVSSDKKTCTVSGNAAGVTLYATIKRNKCLMDKVSLPIGTIGIPSKLITLNGHCAGTNYEITSKIEHPGIAGCSYSYNYNIPASSDGSYYVIKSGQYAYWVFKTPNGLQYSGTVTAAQPGCSSISNTQYAIIYSQWCGTSYKSTTDKDLTDPEENSLLVSPNPVTNDLTLTHIGKGTNDIRIYDLSGSLVYSVKTAQTVTIDVSMIPRGIYIVRYFVDDAVNQARPIKIVLE
jgi:hypothetical protein